MADVSRIVKKIVERKKKVLSKRRLEASILNFLHILNEGSLDTNGWPKLKIIFYFSSLVSVLLTTH